MSPNDSGASTTRRKRIFDGGMRYHGTPLFQGIVITVHNHWNQVGLCFYCDVGNATLKFPQCTLAGCTGSFRENQDTGTIMQMVFRLFNQVFGVVIVANETGRTHDTKQKRIAKQFVFDDTLAAIHLGQDHHDIEQCRMIGDDQRTTCGSQAFNIFGLGDGHTGDIKHPCEKAKTATDDKLGVFAPFGAVAQDDHHGGENGDGQQKPAQPKG